PGAHPRAGLATEPRVGELLDQSGEPAGMSLDERGGEIQERVAPLAARGVAGETAKYLIEKSHGDLQVSSSARADGKTTRRCAPWDLRARDFGPDGARLRAHQRPGARHSPCDTLRAGFGLWSP